MSCGGNTFRCGIGRFNRFNTSDKPSNQQLHSENESNLSALLRLREEQDKGVFNSAISNSTISNTDTLQLCNNKLESNKLESNKSDNIYTPFKYRY
jgi:hypothetical protein